MDNIKTWTGVTGLPVEGSIRMTEDRYKWRKYVHAWPTGMGSRMAKEQNRTIALLSNGEIAHKERRRTVEVREDMGVESS